MHSAGPGGLFLDLWTAARRAVRLVSDVLAEEGVDDSELACLLHLAGAAEGMTLTALAEAMGVPYMSVSDAVSRLEHRGDAQRRAHPGDRRATLVTLTATGTRRAGEAAPLLDALARRVAKDAALTPRELHALAERLRDAMA